MSETDPEPRPVAAERPPASPPPRPATPGVSGDRGVFAGLCAVSVTGALGLASILLIVGGYSPTAAFTEILRGSVGSVSAVVATLNHAAPLLLVATGVCIAARAGLMSIGQEGQLTMGGLVGAAVGLGMPGPLFVVLPTVLVSAAIGGALWAAAAAALKYARGVHEVISTLLLNFLAFQVLSFAVNRPWLLQETLPAGSVQAPNPQSDLLPETARMPTLVAGQGFRLTFAIACAVALALIVGFVLARTSLGLRLRMVGLNPRAARRAGVSATLFGSGALVASGAFAGLGGGVLLTATTHKVQQGFSNNYGWEGLLVALVAGLHPVASIGVALLFGALRSGGGMLAATGVSSSIVGVVQALVVIAVSLPALYVHFRRRRREQLLASQRA